MFQKVSRVAMIALVLATLSACKNLSPENKSESLSYDLTENGCSTGKHTFGSVQEMCAGLQDDSLNNNCASGLRAERYAANCR